MRACVQVWPTASGRRVHGHRCLLRVETASPCDGEPVGGAVRARSRKSYDRSTLYSVPLRPVPVAAPNSCFVIVSVRTPGGIHRQQSLYFRHSLLDSEPTVGDRNIHLLPQPLPVTQPPRTAPHQTAPETPHSCQAKPSATLHTQAPAGSPASASHQQACGTASSMDGDRH